MHKLSKLLIGQKKLNMALKTIDKGLLNIAIGHHSIECLNSQERELFLNNLSDYGVDIYLSGHIHQHKAAFDTNNINDVCMFSCSSGMSDDFSTVGIITGEIDISSGENSVTFHKWESKKEYWHIATDVSRKFPKGVLEFKINKFVSGKPKPISVVNNEIKNHIPFRKNDNFTGRDDELKDLHNYLQQKTTVSITGIAGLRGIGKTQLVVEYAIYR